MKKTVWAITDGHYSDYHVVGLFSSKENAKKIQEITGGNGNIEEWQLDPCINEINKGLSCFLIIMDYSGNVEMIIKQNPSSYAIGKSLFVWERSKAPLYKGKNINDAVNGNVWAKDEKHAIKIANEFRSQAIAENKMFPAKSN